MWQSTGKKQTMAMWSFAIPDGLTMDPLAPTALAVSTVFMERIGSGLSLLRDHGKKVQKYMLKSKKFEVLKKSWKSVVNIVLVDARGLPETEDNGGNYVYCKFRLGGETHKSKCASKSSRPSWRERFNLHLYEDSNLEITVWHKGKQKNFMGKCMLDLSRLEKERTHELWQELECGFGTVHFLVTLSGTARNTTLDSIPTSNGCQLPSIDQDRFAWYRLCSDWGEVGQLSVVVHGARGLSSGLSGKADAYCVVELDNARVQTHSMRGTCEPNWNKSYVFGVNDVTSTLDITVYDESIITSMKAEALGKISIPLLRIVNDEKKWYALKNRSRKTTAKGNCPRILLQMYMTWNPIKASVRVLSPKQTKYTQKPPKFDIPLIYSNLEFIKAAFDCIYTTSEYTRKLFEWENRERSLVALAGWLSFWYFFRFWMTPLVLLVPFIYHWSIHRSQSASVSNYITDNDSEQESDDSVQKDEKTLKNRINTLQDLTLTIKNGIDFAVSLLERMGNLANFTVPYLSYLTMLFLAVFAVLLYTVPINYIFMAIGIYKFTRKLLYPERVPNHDLVDFIMRAPDKHIAKQWRELKVPEPKLTREDSVRQRDNRNLISITN